MHIDVAYPSNYLKGAELQGRSVRVTIARLAIEDVGDDRRPVLYFEGKDKGMVLNRTNANVIAEAYGQETDNWGGALIEIYFDDNVFYAGKRTGGLRVRIPKRAPPQTLPPQQRQVQPMTYQHSDEEAPPLDDEIPF